MTVLKSAVCCEWMVEYGFVQLRVPCEPTEIRIQPANMHIVIKEVGTAKYSVNHKKTRFWGTDNHGEPEGNMKAEKESIYPYISYASAQ